VCAGVGLCHAQDPPQVERSAAAQVVQPSNPDSSLSSVAAVPASNPETPSLDANDERMFKLLPNYRTVSDPSQPFSAIGAADKFKLVLHYFDPFVYGFTATQSIIQQAAGADKGYGQGVEGYSKRYGANFADAFTNQLFTVGVFPTLLHEDPRYFRKGQGGVFLRTLYALSRDFVTRTDSGTERYNFSEVLGNLSSGAISNLYYPQGDRRPEDILTRMGFQMGYDAMFNVLKEFYPDLKKKFHRK
jgi:hypothetical protein